MSLVDAPVWTGVIRASRYRGTEARG